MFRTTNLGLPAGASDTNATIGVYVQVQMAQYGSTYQKFKSFGFNDIISVYICQEKHESLAVHVKI